MVEVLLVVRWSNGMVYSILFFFWVPNLLVAEFFIRSSTNRLPKSIQLSGSLMLWLVIIFISLATYNITTKSWGPAILGMFGL